MLTKDLEQLKEKKLIFFPYEQKTKIAYFIYLGLCAILFLSVFIFCLFATINVSKYQLYKLNLTNFNYNILNLLYTPIICLLTITISMFLLILAPKVSVTSSKYSSIMFYSAFGLLIFSVMLSAEVQLSYISQSAILDNTNYHGMKPIVARIFIIITIFLILVVQVFFGIMRRKFTFMNSDYEIYTNRNMLKKEKKLKNKKRN